MSHVATAWAIKQRGLKPATRVVLWTLADCHNPAIGCFPTQSYLAEACEMSRSTVNLHLDILEAQGLIRREAEVDERTKRQRPTRYHLALDAVSESRTQAVSEIETRSVSEKPAEPCPKNGESRVRNSDTNLVREPVREPVTENAREFAAFWSVYPRKVGKDAARKAWASARKRADLAAIVAGLHGFVAATKGAEQRFIPHPATWLNQGRWQDDQSHARNGPRSSAEDLRGLATISAADDVARLMAPERKAIG